MLYVLVNRVGQFYLLIYQRVMKLRVNNDRTKRTYSARDNLSKPRIFLIYWGIAYIIRLASLERFPLVEYERDPIFYFRGFRRCGAKDNGMKLLNFRYLKKCSSHFPSWVIGFLSSSTF
jgi:hypothetical protein